MASSTPRTLVDLPTELILAIGSHTRLDDRMMLRSTARFFLEHRLWTDARWADVSRAGRMGHREEIIPLFRLYADAPTHHIWISYIL